VKATVVTAKPTVVTVKATVVTAKAAVITLSPWGGAVYSYKGTLVFTRRFVSAGAVSPGAGHKKPGRPPPAKQAAGGRANILTQP
jgi:hypothetical protein